MQDVLYASCKWLQVCCDPALCKQFWENEWIFLHLTSPGKLQVMFPKFLIVPLDGSVTLWMLEKCKNKKIKGNDNPFRGKPSVVIFYIIIWVTRVRQVGYLWQEARGGLDANPCRVRQYWLRRFLSLDIIAN